MCSKYLIWGTFCLILVDRFAKMGSLMPMISILCGAVVLCKGMWKIGIVISFFAELNLNPVYNKRMLWNLSASLDFGSKHLKECPNGWTVDQTVWVWPTLGRGHCVVFWGIPTRANESLPKNQVLRITLRTKSHRGVRVGAEGRRNTISHFMLLSGTWRTIIFTWNKEFDWTRTRSSRQMPGLLNSRLLFRFITLNQRIISAIRLMAYSEVPLHIAP